MSDNCISYSYFLVNYVLDVFMCFFEKYLCLIAKIFTSYIGRIENFETFILIIEHNF